MQPFLLLCTLFLARVVSIERLSTLSGLTDWSWRARAVDEEAFAGFLLRLYLRGGGVAVGASYSVANA